LGVVKLSEVHLSSRFMIETDNGERILRNPESGENNSEKGFFASESKLYLSYDDFGF
jgi:hypothetical protein